MNAISIWQPAEVDGQAAFVRPEPYPLGDHFADRKVIFQEKKPGCRRICFFGESVAAGYGYAPGLTPSKILEQQLQHIGGTASFEVIDLARTNETIEGLTQTLENALQLQPDVLLVFSGNNWTMLETPECSPYFPDPDARREYARLWREKGLYGPNVQAQLRVLQKAAAAYNRINLAARAAGIPVILITPETNLADWENRQPPRWLPGDGAPRWYALYEQALAQLRRGEWAAAEATAWQMEDLDGATCPTTYRLLVRSITGREQRAKARLAAQAEVDANSYTGLCFLGAPQLHSGWGKLQQKAAAHHGFSRIGLAEIFEKYSGSPLPDRRLFIDYCHLSSEGMQVAMAAVSAEVLRQTGHPKATDWQALLRQLPPPDITAAAEATARFGAAIHTAHRHLPLDDDVMPAYWCRVALEADPGVRSAMQDFALARLSGQPAVLTVALRRNQAAAYPLTMQHGWNFDYIDAPMIRAIEETTGLDFTEESTALLQRLLQEKQGFDLLHPPFFLWNPVERFFPEAMEGQESSRRAFYRSAWPNSSFAVPGRPAGNLSLRLTLRLPAVPGWQKNRTGMVAVYLNEVQVGEMPAGARWSTGMFELRPEWFRFSMNRLTLCWPPLPPCGDVALRHALERLEQGLEADLHPVFGEVFSIRVRRLFTTD